jgi:DNA repair photolyase
MFERVHFMWQIQDIEAKSILSRTSGFIKQAGFTHSLSPARNCTYGCTYCYVPTMGIYGGLQPGDAKHWGEFTAMKRNAGELLRVSLDRRQVIYCSPLVDPYQPAEREQPLMPAVLSAILGRPPLVLAIQTRGTLIMRDVSILREVAAVTRLRISFSLTTDRDDVRKRYEPHCESISDRLKVIEGLVANGLEVYATLAPLLPCNPEELARMAVGATGRDLIGDPFHVRSTKPRGATTRSAAVRLARRFGEEDWFRPEFQEGIVCRVQETAASLGRRFFVGPEGFGRLAEAINPRLWRHA